MPGSSKPKQLLATWLERQLEGDKWTWLSRNLDQIAEGATEKTLQITFGMIPRKLGRDDLVLGADDLKDADAARTGWNPADWSVDGAARILTLLTVAESGSNTSFAERFEDLCRTADLNEGIALYRGLPLFPEPETLDFAVGEGLRTSIRAVFEAIAHRNPYPKEVFDEHRWNHMVLKALFIDATLAPINGLDQRANPSLARILCDYAHERWAANRPVTHELWRCVGPFAEGAMIDDLERALDEGDISAKAAALALNASPDTRAVTILKNHPELAQPIKDGTLTWDQLTIAVEGD